MITISDETLRGLTSYVGNAGGQVANVRTTGGIGGYLNLRDCPDWTVERFTASDSIDRDEEPNENFKAVRGCHGLRLDRAIIHSGYRGVQVSGADTDYPDGLLLQRVLFSGCRMRCPTFAGNMRNAGGRGVMREFVVHDWQEFGTRVMRGAHLVMRYGLYIPTERSDLELMIDTLAGTVHAGSVRMVDVYAVSDGEVVPVEGSRSTNLGRAKILGLLDEMGGWGAQPHTDEERRVIQRVKRDAAVKDRGRAAT